jgi:D-serine deaminase-like pyridoxal phosphate-dependent protein
MQHQIGSCKSSQIAVALACPIVAIHKRRSEIVIYGGGVHFSKDHIEDEEGHIYGRIVEETASGWGDIIPGIYVKSLSQEHGIVSVPKGMIEKYSVGDHLLILPVHSCMTADLMKHYQTLKGELIPKLN